MWRICGLLVVTALGASAFPVKMDSGNITFDVPDDFTQLTPDEIAVKFPRHAGPIEAVGNQTRGASISYAVTTNRVRADQLDDFARYMETTLPKLSPGLQWIAKEPREINGTKWFYLEFTTSSSDGGIIHNFEVFTSYHDVLVILNFNATANLFDLYEKEFRNGVNSLTINKATDT